MTCQQQRNLGVHFVVLALALPSLASCKFLATKGLDDLSSEMPASEEFNLLNQLEAAYGRDHRLATERRVRRLEDAMRPTYNSLPKEESGRLGAIGVRYMLNRLFVTRHGWFFRGLRDNGENWSDASPTEVLENHASADVQNVFAKQLDTHGFDLHHAAVLAATLENFVHTESVERLEAVYKYLDISPNKTDITDAEVTRIMEAYLVTFVLHRHYQSLNPRWMDEVLAGINKLYPGWPKTLKFLKEIREAVLEDEERESSEDDAPYTANSWNTTLKILERFGEQYGRWQNHECVDMKKKLVELEEPGTGRVLLTRFYGSGQKNPEHWHFRESLDYLRLLGALDESDSTKISVVIPNYINGANNCVAGSKSYDVCCIDECDALMSHVEKHIVASEASPRQILEVVTTLPSDTVEAPRQISETLSQRLDEIASHHGGLVPLHGRLFAQWMHHAYPRECSYPHLSGNAKFMTQKAFTNQTGSNAGLQAHELSKAIDDISAKAALAGNNQRSASDGTSALPWSAEEELFASKKKNRTESSTFSALRRFVFLLLSGFSVCAMLYRTLTVLDPKGKAQFTSCADKSNHKYLV